MFKSLRRFFSPPTYEDLERNRQARFITRILYVVFGIAGLAILAAPFGITRPERVLPAGVLLLITGVAVRQLLHQGRLHAAGGLLSAVVWLTLTIAHIQNGGIHSVSLVVYILAIMIASLTLNIWERLAYIAASAGAMGLFIWLENTGRYTFPEVTTGAMGTIFAIGLTMIGADALIQVALRDLRQIVTRLQENERRLTESNQDLQASRSLLEARSRDLEERTRILEQRSKQLQTIAELGHTITELNDLDEILQRAVKLISQRFAFYHVGIFLRDAEGQYAILHAANSQGGQKMLARGHRLKIGEQGIVGYVAAHKQARIALDVGQDAVHFENPDLPHTRSEMALPLVAGNTLVGVLDIQSIQENAFTQEDVDTLQILANQLAIAIRNALLFAENQRALESAQRAYAESTRQAWAQFLHSRRQEGYLCDELDMVSPVSEGWPPEMQAALQAGESILVDDLTLAAPVQVRGQTIGVLRLRKSPASPPWNADERSLVDALAEQLGLAVDSARLYTTTQRRAERERLTAEIVNRIRASNDPHAILQTAVQELRQALGVSAAQVLIHPEQ